MVQSPAAHDEILRIGIDRLFPLDAAADVPDEFEVERLSEAAGDLALRVRKISAVGLEPVGPNMRTTFGVDQLNIHPNLIASPPYAAFEDIPNAEFAADLLHVDGLTPVGEGRVAGNHKASRYPREICSQIVGDAIGEIFLVWITRQVGKGQDDD